MRKSGGERLVSGLEAMLYAFFFVVALAIAGMLFGVSLQASHEAARLERAVQLAGDMGARFSARPADAVEDMEADGLRAVCEVQPVSKAFGHIYQATISVYDGDESIYELECARYVSARGGA